MPRNSKKQAKDGSAQQKAESAAVIDLRMDSSTPVGPREMAVSDDGGLQTPCTITGLMAGLSGGTLGYVFGFGGYWMRHIRGGGQWRLSLAEGWSTATTFGVMGGLYAAVNCFMQRLRQKTDAWNGAASGCATGLALGWKQGPLGALQSCAMLGAFSFFVDGMGGGAAAAAASPGWQQVQGGAAEAGTPFAATEARDGGSEDGGLYQGGDGSTPGWRQQRQQQQQRGPIELLLSPAMPLLAAVAPCAFPGTGSRGCSIAVRRR